MKKSSWFHVIGHGSGQIAGLANLKDFFLVSCQEIPSGRIWNAKFLCVILKHGLCIVARVDAMTQNTEIGFTLKLFVNPKHFFFHDRANGRAACKKEIGHIDFARHIFLANGISYLIDESKVCNAMVHRILIVIYIAFPKDR